MTALQKAEQLLTEMTPAEKSQLLEVVARELSGVFPGVERTPGVCGGDPCIVRTRIPVWVVEQARRLGASDEKILQMYPTLTADDLINAFAYARAHREEIDRMITENEAA